MVILYGGEKKKQQTNQQLCRLGKESITWFLFVCYHGDVCERKRTSACLHSSVQSQPSWKQAASWPRNCSWEPCGIRMQERGFLSDEQTPSERLSWWTIFSSQLGIGPNKAHMHPCWSDSLEGPCWNSQLGFWSSHVGLALPLWVFFIFFLGCMLSGECIHNMGLTKKLLLNPKDYNSSWDIGVVLMSLNSRD